MKIIEVTVKPRARVRSLEKTADGRWLARLKSPPVDGRANAELREMIAREFDCPPSAVSIKSGATGRVKLIRVNDR